MPSTLVLNADRNVRPALGTWIDNNADLLLGFSLRIAEDVLAQLQLQGKASSLNIQPTLAIEKGGDIALAAGEREVRKELWKDASPLILAALTSQSQDVRVRVMRLRMLAASCFRLFPV